MVSPKPYTKNPLSLGSLVYIEHGPTKGSFGYLLRYGSPRAITTPQEATSFSTWCKEILSVGDNVYTQCKVRIIPLTSTQRHSRRTVSAGYLRLLTISDVQNSATIFVANVNQLMLQLEPPKEVI